MLRVHSAFKFSKFKTSLPEIISSSLGTADVNDYRQLRLTQQSSLREIYYSYMKHMRLYEIQKLDLKMVSVRDAYIKVLKERMKNLDQLTEEEKKDLRFLMDNNFGFPFVEGVRRSEMIAKYFLEAEEKRFYHYPRLSLLAAWLILGIPSYWLSDSYA